MPSGDSIQAALFVIFLYHLGVHPILIIIFHVGVCLGRVYYMCHWIGDTLVATVLGSFVGHLLLYLYTNRHFHFVPLKMDF